MTKTDVLRKLLRTAAIVGLSVGLTGMVLTSCCSTKKVQVANSVPTVPASMKGQHPEYFSGVIPCADCPGIRMDLFLGTGFNPNGGHFELTETYLERNVKPLQTKGNWAYSNGDEYPGMKVIILNVDKAKKDQRYFLRLSGERLELLDNGMKKINSGLNFKLELQGNQN